MAGGWAPGKCCDVLRFSCSIYGKSDSFDFPAFYFFFFFSDFFEKKSKLVRFALSKTRLFNEKLSKIELSTAFEGRLFGLVWGPRWSPKKSGGVLGSAARSQRFADKNF